ncbi:MAG: DUF1178 family protein [Thermodesulfobacteriota bacterium]
MIVFDLQCVQGHRFEGWFEDSRGYEEQQAKSLISCPVCDSTEITKALSTFGIKSPSPKPPAGAENSEQLTALRRQFTEFLDTHFDDVGCDFAKEALKIHYGAAEPRNIRGKSTSDEEKVLKEEGVQYLKFPVEPKPESDS